VIGQHRAGGQRGGKGKTGLHKHKWSYVIKYAPNYFGNHGFTPIKRIISNTINVGELDEKVEMLLVLKKASKDEEGIKIDLNNLGFDKLLGGGRVSHPLIIKSKASSKSAIKKIKEAGGKILD
jgi:large subunit ribosomal protein L15